MKLRDVKDWKVGDSVWVIDTGMDGKQVFRQTWIERLIQSRNGGDMHSNPTFLMAVIRYGDGSLGYQNAKFLFREKEELLQCRGMYLVKENRPGAPYEWSKTLPDGYTSYHWGGVRRCG
ncbi:MAG: hypothetical protein LIO67_05635 [Lachnospiraceae bacterium]|nr:hypothetical protein [Lachnospiraceae bacterium]